MIAKHGWQFWIDRGGTFTDIIGRGPDGRLIVDKRLSESATGSVDPGIAGALAMLGRHDGPDASIEVIRIGTTVATNALLERQGGVCAVCGRPPKKKLCVDQRHW